MIRYNYTLEGNEIVMDAIEATYEGESQDIGNMPAMNFMLNGNELVTYQLSDAENYVYMIYVLIEK